MITSVPLSLLAWTVTPSDCDKTTYCIVTCSGIGVCVGVAVGVFVGVDDVIVVGEGVLESGVPIGVTLGVSVGEVRMGVDVGVEVGVFEGAFGLFKGIIMNASVKDSIVIIKVAINAATILSVRLFIGILFNMKLTEKYVFR